jgi:hypothetical protein
MDIGKTKTAFQEVIRMLSPEINGLLPEGGIGEMSKFYKIERIDGCDIKNDGDMLLFQYSDLSRLLQ